jgi:hypothetical protein
MRLRSKTQADASAGIRLDDDDAVVSFAGSVAALADVWSSMVWLQTTSTTFTLVRRAIARWARDTDSALAEMFGRSVQSEEVRHLLDGLAAVVPRQVSPAEREWLVASAAEAQRLSVEGRAAITQVTG